MKKYQLVTVQESTYFEMNKDEFDLDEDGFIEDELAFFEGDPDILYLDGEVVGYTAICHSDYGGDTELIYWGDDQEGLELVRQWADDSDNFEQLKGGWDAVEREGYTFAYRGGQGYSYSIWKLS